MKSRCVVSLLVFLGAWTCASRAAAEDGSPDFAAPWAELVALRDAERAAVQQRLSPGTDALLRLDGAADGEVAWMTVNQRAASGVQAAVRVPAWSQETFSEWWGFVFYRGTNSVRVDRMIEPVEASALQISADGVRGVATVTFHCDRLRSARLAPGQHLIKEIANDPSWYDRFRSVGRTVPRPQSLRIDAAVVPGAWYVDALLENFVEQRAGFKVTTSSPQVVGLPIHAATPTWNAGHHRVREVESHCDGSTYRALWQVTLMADNWFPKDDRSTSATVAIQAAIGNDGSLRGTWTASGEISASGAISGVIGRLLSGNWRGDGAFGDSRGQVMGRWNAAPTAISVAPVATPTDAASAMRGATEIWQQIRALRRMARQPGLSLQQALSDAWTPPASAADALTAATYIRQLVRAAELSPQPMPATRSVPVSGPTTQWPASGASTPGWYHIPSWQVLGPFAQSTNETLAVDNLCAVQYGPGLSYDAQSLLHAQRGWPVGGGGAKDGLRSWTARTLDTALLAMTDDQRGVSIRWNPATWYATTTITASSASTVLLAIEAYDAGALWVNDRLLWSGGADSWQSRARGDQVIAVPLRAGANQLMVRVRSDRAEAWCRVRIGVGIAESPVVSAQTHPSSSGWRGDGSGVIAATPPLAWDLATGRNVAWSATVAARAQPVIQGDQVLVLTASGLTALAVSDGTQRWTTPINGMKKSPETPACDASTIVVAHDGSLSAFSRDGARRWSVATGLAEACVRLSGDQAIVVGPGAKGEVTVQAYALSDGAGRWKKSVAAPWHDEGALIMQVVLDRAYDLIVLAHGGLLDARDGSVLDAGVSMGRSQRARLSGQGGRIWLSAMGRTLAGSVVATRDNGALRAQTQWSWEANHEVSGSGDGMAWGVGIAGQRFMQWNPVVERAPHAPIPRLEVRSQSDQSTDGGRRLGGIKGILGGDPTWDAPLPPLLCGSTLYLVHDGSISGGGVLGKKARCAVMRWAEAPFLLAVNDIPTGCQPPMAVGDRLFLAAPDRLWCVQNRDAAWQREQIAQRLIEDVGSVVPARVRELPAAVGEEAVALSRLPIHTVASDPVTQIPSMGRWVGGPVAADAVVDGVRLPAQAADTSAQSALIDAGPALTVWPHDGVVYELQGRGIALPSYRHSLSRAQLFGPTLSGVGVIMCALEVGSPSMVSYSAERPGLTVWIDGQRIERGETVRLLSGLHRCMVRIDSRYLDRPVPSAKIDVDKAIAAGALREVSFRDWSVVGPFAESEFSPTMLTASAPTQARSFTPTSTAPIALRDVLGSGGVPADHNGKACVIHATMTMPQDGRWVLNASADWFMEIAIDGEIVYSTMGNGNRADVKNLAAHTIARQMTAGEHRVAIAVKPGSKGWAFWMRSGLIIDENALKPLTVYPPGSDPEPPKMTGNNVSPDWQAWNFRQLLKTDGFTFALKQSHDPSRLLATWQERIRMRRDDLRALLASPGAPAIDQRLRELLAAAPE